MAAYALFFLMKAGHQQQWHWVNLPMWEGLWLECFM